MLITWHEEIKVVLMVYPGTVIQRRNASMGKLFNYMLISAAGFRGQDHLNIVLLRKENEVQCAKVNPNCAVP